MYTCLCPIIILESKLDIFRMSIKETLCMYNAQIHKCKTSTFSVYILILQVLKVMYFFKGSNHIFRQKNCEKANVLLEVMSLIDSPQPSGNFCVHQSSERAWTPFTGRTSLRAKEHKTYGHVNVSLPNVGNL